MIKLVFTFILAAVFSLAECNQKKVVVHCAEYRNVIVNGQDLEEQCIKKRYIYKEKINGRWVTVKDTIL